jgi:hypothetical protein
MVSARSHVLIFIISVALLTSFRHLFWDTLGGFGAAERRRAKAAIQQLPLKRLQ